MPQIKIEKINSFLKFHLDVAFALEWQIALHLNQWHMRTKHQISSDMPTRVEPVVMAGI